MSHGLRAGLLTAALLVLAIASACSGTPDESLTSPTPPVSESPASSPPSPSPSPSPTSERDVAAANAEALVHEYYRVSDLVGSDPSRPLTDLEAVATSIVLDSDKREFERWRRDGWLQTGSTLLVEVALVDVSLDNSDPSAGKIPTVRFDVCYDISDGDVVDADGNSIVPAGQPKRAWERLVVANYSWDTDPTAGWRVASAETLEQPPCETAA